MERNASEELIRVRYAETDMMGHVYYSNYLIWFEIGRTGMLRDLGMPYEQIEEMGYRLPVVEAHALYKSEVKYPEEIIIRSRVTELGRATVTIHYELWNKTTDKLAAEGSTVHVLVNQSMKAVSIPGPLRKLFESAMGDPAAV